MVSRRGRALIRNFKVMARDAGIDLKQAETTFKYYEYGGRNYLQVHGRWRDGEYSGLEEIMRRIFVDEAIALGRDPSAVQVGAND